MAIEKAPFGLPVVAKKMPQGGSGCGSEGVGLTEDWGISLAAFLSRGAL